MAQGEVQRMIDDLATRLGRSVVVNDPDMHLLHASGHFGDEDPARIHAVLHRGAAPHVVGHVLAQGVTTWTSPGLVPAKPEIGMSARVCFPMRCRSELVGLGMVMDADGTLTTREIDLVSGVLGDVAERMVDERMVDERGAVPVDAAVEEARVADLLGDGARTRALALDQLRLDGVLAHLPHVRVTTVVTEGMAGHELPPADVPHADVALRHAFRSARAAHRGSVLTTVGGGRAAMVQLTASPLADDAARTQARALVAQVEGVSDGRFRAVAGVGDPVEGAEHAWLSRRQAEVASRGVRVLGLDGAAVPDDLGVHAVLLRVPADELDASILPAALRRLLAADRRGQLVATLTAYLDGGCSGPTAADALHIHRTTLYYRLDRIRDLAGVDLDDGETRLQLHLGIRMLRLLEP